MPAALFDQRQLNGFSNDFCTSTTHLKVLYAETVCRAGRSCRAIFSGAATAQTGA
jgi:hypothetical protein